MATQPPNGPHAQQDVLQYVSHSISELTGVEANEGSEADRVSETMQLLISSGLFLFRFLQDLDQYTLPSSGQTASTSAVGGGEIAASTTAVGSTSATKPPSNAAGSSGRLPADVLSFLDELTAAPLKKTGSPPPPGSHVAPAAARKSPAVTADAVNPIPFDGTAVPPKQSALPGPTNASPVHASAPSTYASRPATVAVTNQTVGQNAASTGLGVGAGGMGGEIGAGEKSAGGFTEIDAADVEQLRSNTSTHRPGIQAPVSLPTARQTLATQQEHENGPAATRSEPGIQQQPQMQGSQLPQQQPQTMDGSGNGGAVGSWSWNTLWSQAQAATANLTAATAKVTNVTASSLTKGLEQAQQMAKETAKAVGSADMVKELVEDIKNQRLDKIGTDITKLTKTSVTTLVDTIAPPLNPTSRSPASPSSSTPVQQYASKITVWFCLEATIGENIDAFHDFLQSIANELLLDRRPDEENRWGGAKGTKRLCDKVVVNSVKDPNPKCVNSLEEAMENVEAILGRLEKLSASQPQPSTMQTDSNIPPSRALYIVVQPFQRHLTSVRFGTLNHLQYLLVLAYEHESKEEQEKQAAGEDGTSSTVKSLKSVTVVSQSVGRPVVDGVEDGGEKKAAMMAKWAEQQRDRILEGALADICEEFTLSFV
ncbi:hypothetical protein HK102_009960 [Quaeritorhiza haematococci]|nr:hypothetical protein HK102_009960 [Quaeritorhiza haematococci]